MNLVTSDWLENHLEDPALRVIDIRGKALTPETYKATMLDHYGDYVQRHIPGALWVNWVKDITDDPNHKRVAPAQNYAQTLNSLGIDKDQFVVIYDDASNALAARMWWTLQYYGLPNAAVLDGGWKKWLTEDRPTTADMPQHDTTDAKIMPRKELLREGDEILNQLGGTTRIVDMRLPEEYNGEMSFTRQSGHIPGAVNLPVNTLVNGDNTLLEADALRERLAQAGIDDSATEVIFYSNVGVMSCLGILAMRVAGLSAPAANYDASWQEWGNDETKPVE